MRLSLITSLVLALIPSQQVTGQDLDAVLANADKLLEEAKADYELARSGNSVPGFIEAGFKLESCRIKYLVLQEIGPPEKQKIAADRLRAVNQLSKLIHDGKVAVNGPPPGEAPPAPTSADPAKPPATPEPAAPVRPAVDVSKRAPVPDPAKQKESEKLIKDLFKEQFAKKGKSDRQELTRQLLRQADKTAEDLPALWVLYREAQDSAAQACDLTLLATSIDAMARVFDIDAMSLRASALTASEKAAKVPADYSNLCDQLLLLAEEQVAADQYEAAEKAVALGLQCARKAADGRQVARTTSRQKELVEAKTLFRALKSAIETLAKKPDDPTANLEMGQFLCFVKGNWDLGLRFLVKGSDTVLKPLAEKELTNPESANDRVLIADGWADLADKEKSPLRKIQTNAHARSIYEGVLSQTTGLVRARIEKKLGEMGSVGGGTKGPLVDLLKLVNPEKDSMQGKWTMVGNALQSPPAGPNVMTELHFPYELPEEYDLAVTMERKSGANWFQFSLCSGKAFFTVTFDAWLAQGGISGLQRVDNQAVRENPTARPGQVFFINKPVNVQISVRRTGVLAIADGKTILDWKEGYSRVSRIVQKPPTLGLEIWEGTFTFSKLQVTPIGSGGKVLR